MKLTEAEYEALMRQKWRRVGDKAPVQIADLEPVASGKPMGAQEDTRPDTSGSCTIHIHSRTKRLADADGRSAKAVIDGLVHAGIIKDDSPRYVSEVSQSQEKTSGDEETIITLTWR